MGNTEYNGLEKRKHLRTIYPAAKRPIFRARGEELKIKDVSRGGLKFCNRDKVKIKGWVEGTIDLTDGTCIKVEGIIVRVENDDMGMSFIGELDDDAYRKIPLTNQFPAN
jgi:PilZ domain